MVEGPRLQIWDKIRNAGTNFIEQLFLVRGNLVHICIRELYFSRMLECVIVQDFVRYGRSTEGTHRSIFALPFLPSFPISLVCLTYEEVLTGSVTIFVALSRTSVSV